MSLRFVLKENVTENPFYKVWRGKKVIGAIDYYRGKLTFGSREGYVFLTKEDLKELWGFMVKLKGNLTR